MNGCMTELQFGRALVADCGGGDATTHGRRTAAAAPTVMPSRPRVGPTRQLTTAQHRHA